MTDNYWAGKMSGLVQWDLPAPLSVRSPEPWAPDMSDDRTPSYDLFTQDDAARLFTREIVMRHRFVPEYKGWVEWTGHVWARDPSGDAKVQSAFRKWIADVADAKGDQIYQAAARGGDAEKIEEAVELIRNMKKSYRSSTFMGAVLKLASSEACLNVPLTAFDADPYVVNTPGGAYDLRTGEPADVGPCPLFLKSTTVAPDFDAETPLWEQVLLSISPGSKDLPAYIEKILGVSLIGGQNVQQFWMLAGVGGSGKGTICNAVCGILGTGEDGYASTINAKDLMSTSRSNPEYFHASLFGKRFVVASEGNKHEAFDAQRVNNLTGDDVLPARLPYGRPFSFQPSHNLFLMSNHRPRVDDEDTGFWRRFREIPFLFKPLEAIPQLKERLLAEEAAGMLARLITAAGEYFREGLVTPQEVKDATEDNRAGQNNVEEFFSLNVANVEGEYTLSNTLWSAYVRWCKLNGYSKEETVGNTAFGRKVPDDYPSDQKKVGGRNVTVRENAQLLHDYSDSEY